MYFEAFLDKKKKNDIITKQNMNTTDTEDESNSDQPATWIDTIRGFNEKELRSYLDLITLSCVLLASKMNEQNAHQPSMRSIQKCCGNRYAYDDFVQMERYLIIECLDWNMNLTTPYHFSDCL